MLRVSWFCFLFVGVALGLALVAAINWQFVPALVYLAWAFIVAVGSVSLRKMGY